MPFRAGVGGCCVWHTSMRGLSPQAGGFPPAPKQKDGQRAQQTYRVSPTRTAGGLPNHLLSASYSGTEQTCRPLLLKSCKPHYQQKWPNFAKHWQNARWRRRKSLGRRASVARPNNRGISPAPSRVGEGWRRKRRQGIRFANESRATRSGGPASNVPFGHPRRSVWRGRGCLVSTGRGARCRSCPGNPPGARRTSRSCARARPCSRISV